MDDTKPTADTTAVVAVNPSIFTRVVDSVENEAHDVKTKFVDVWDADVRPIFVDDVEPFFKNALALVERNGGALLITAAKDLLNSVGDIASGKWGDFVAQLLLDAKAAGASTLAAEESLAASTALQLAQASQAVVVTAASPVDKATGTQTEAAAQ